MHQCEDNTLNNYKERAFKELINNTLYIYIYEKNCNVTCHCIDDDIINYTTKKPGTELLMIIKNKDDAISNYTTINM